MILDGATTRLLQNLPADLKARRWEIVRSKSQPIKTFGATRYQAVYMRPMEHGADDDRMNTIAHLESRSFVHVSTRSASWKDALQDAIGLMREVDARRSDSEDRI